MGKSLLVFVVAGFVVAAVLDGIGQVLLARRMGKKRIIAEGNIWYYKFEGQFSKGKIHCSCPMCRVKSCDCKQARDIRRMDSMNYSMRAA